MKNYIQAWVENLECNNEAGFVYDKEGVKGITYKNQKTASEVVFYTIKGLGHMWPGGDYAMRKKGSSALNATDLIWEFFKNHIK